MTRYESFYRFVYPALRLYNIPAVLSVVTSWIDNPETSGYRTKRFMSWPQIREVSDSGLVTVASHSARLHRLLQANPVGNVEPAPATFLYFPRKRALRDGARVPRPHPRGPRLEHRYADGAAGQEARRSSPGPTGATTRSAIEEAKKLGFEMILTLDDGYSGISSLDRVNRYYLESHLDWLAAFKDSLRRGLQPRSPHPGRADRSRHDRQQELRRRERPQPGAAHRSARHAGREHGLPPGLLRRRGATGNVKSLYFANSVLPVEMDFLSHAVNRIRSARDQGLRLDAVACLRAAGSGPERGAQGREWKDGKPVVTASWYRRLSPFDTREPGSKPGRSFATLRPRLSI